MVIHKGKDIKALVKLSASLVKAMINRAIMRFFSDCQLSKKLMLLTVMQFIVLNTEYVQHLVNLLEGSLAILT